MLNQLRKVAAVLVLACPLIANANLITNSGFETGDLTGWTCAGADLCGAATYMGAHSGTYALAGYDNTGFATVSQTISTTSGSAYDLSFWSRDNVFATGNILRYQIGSGSIITVLETATFAQTATSFVATGSSTLIQFFFETDSGTGTWGIDDVSVTAGTAIPEPGTLALLSLSLLGFGISRRKKA